jgi:ketosteroid isomerase-like protein
MSMVSALGTIVSTEPKRIRSTVEIVSDLYEAFVVGDVEVATQCLAEDFIGHVPGKGLNAGEYWGRKGFHQFMANIASYNGGVFEIEVPVFSVAGEDAFTREVIQLNRASDPGRIWQLNIINWLKVRSGQIVEHWVIPEDQRAYDEYWSAAFVASSSSPRTAAPRKPRRVLELDGAASPENRGVLTHLYERFWRGDADGMRALISDAVVVNIVGKSAMSGVYEGWNGYMKFREKLMNMAGDKYRLDVIALAASARDVWATERIRMNRRWDSSVRELLVLMHFEIDGGRIVRIDDFPLDTNAWERFFTPPASAQEQSAK